MSPTCKRRNTDPPNIKLFLHSAFKIWHVDGRGFKGRGPLVTVAADGDATFTSASHALLCSDEIPADNKFTPLLKSMVLFNCCVGLSAVEEETSLGTTPVPQTTVIDTEHCGKRGKEALKSQTRDGGLFGGGNFRFSGVWLRKVLAALPRSPGERAWSTEQIDGMFRSGFADAQRVSSMVLFMRALASLAGCSMSSFEGGTFTAPAFAAAEPTMKVLSKPGSCLLFFLTEMKCTVQTHLENLADLAHLMFVVFRKAQTSSLPAQNYQNLQTLIKGTFIAATVAKHTGVSDFHAFLESSDRLEILFGILRSMFHGGRRRRPKRGASLPASTSSRRSSSRPNPSPWGS